MTIYAHNNLFIQNKYYTWYYQIIDKARTKKYDDYSEVHHIIPGSLGGSDDADNLIRLSFREHFMCHWLLIKFVKDSIDKTKMSYALQCMTWAKEQSRRIVASWQFEVAKRAAKDNGRGKNNPNYGKKYYNNGTKNIKLSDGEEIPEGFVLGGLPMHSDESKRKISDSVRGKKWYNNSIKCIKLSDDQEIPEGFVLGGLPKSEEFKHKLRGKKHSDETRRKRGDSNRGKKWYNNGIKCIKLSDDQEIPEGFVLGGLPASDENKRKIADFNRGRKWYNNGINNIFISDDEEIPAGFVTGMLPRSKRITPQIYCS
jgi:hypothetical protein